MNTRHQTFFFWLVFIVVFATASCSDKEAASGAEPAAPITQGGQAVDDAAHPQAPESMDEQPWVLKAEPPLSNNLTDAYLENCMNAKQEAFECQVLRRMVAVETEMSMEEIGRSRDQRGAGVALGALDLVDEPKILISAMRILGHFPDTPGIAEKVLPLMLESPYIEVQQTAANVLGANPDPAMAALGSYWYSNHSQLAAEDAYQEYPDFAPHYLDMGFPEYAEAEWFSPADSDRSVGWWTTDVMDTVSGWVGGKLGVKALTFQQWTERMQAQSMAAFNVDQSKQDRVQQLLDQFGKTQNMALLEEVQKLQQELYAPIQAAGEVADRGVETLALPNINEIMEQARYFIAEEKAGHVARLVIVYPLAELGYTVIQHAWNLSDYPSAWPQKAEEPVVP